MTAQPKDAGAGRQLLIDQIAGIPAHALCQVWAPDVDGQPWRVSYRRPNPHYVSDPSFPLAQSLDKGLLLEHAKRTLIESLGAKSKLGRPVWDLYDLQYRFMPCWLAAANDPASLREFEAATPRLAAPVSRNGLDLGLDWCYPDRLHVAYEEADVLYDILDAESNCDQSVHAAFERAADGKTARAVKSITESFAKSLSPLAQSIAKREGMVSGGFAHVIQCVTMAVAKDRFASWAAQIGIDQTASQAAAVDVSPASPIRRRRP